MSDQQKPFRTNQEKSNGEGSPDRTVLARSGAPLDSSRPSELTVDVEFGKTLQHGASNEKGADDSDGTSSEDNEGVEAGSASLKKRPKQDVLPEENPINRKSLI